MKLLRALLPLSLACAVEASPITLFNTGVLTQVPIVLLDSTPNGGNGATEIHWKYNGTQAPITYTANQFFGPGTYLNSGPGTPAPIYPDSMWLSTDGTGGNGAAGIIPFTLGFDFTGLNATSASISGRWATDNCGTALLNVTQFSQIGTPGNCDQQAYFRNWTNFTVNSGFDLNGPNTLTFNLQNAGGLQAIRIEFLESNVTTTAAPEPASLALMGSALLGLGLVRRRKGKSAR